MADQQKFSHIVVGQADQDEVIYAGIKATAEPVQEPTISGAATAVEQQDAPEPEAQVVVEEREAKPEETKVKAARRPASEETASAEQMLKDLEAEPMSGVQRGVLIAAALFVVAFAVYRFVIRSM